MQNQGQPIGKPQPSTSPNDTSSSLSHSASGGRASWLRPTLCGLVIAASCMWIACGDEPPPGAGPLGLTQCTDNLPSDTLQAFDQKCTAAIGIAVPGFDCDKGTLVPENHLSAGIYPNQNCDAPNVLEGVCDPGSRFQVLVQTNEVAIVAHCRKQGLGEGSYDDIAVIQYNKTNGATCFYQALTNLPAIVTAPSEGNDQSQGKFPWLNPADTAAIKCVRCHDNGPFIRSPYLAQLRDEPTNRLPGTKDGTGPFDLRYTWNKDIPYKFIGNDFQSWKAYSVSVTGTGSGCIQCHRLGISSIHGDYLNEGTAQVFALTATATSQSHKNPHSPDAPIWMRPGQILWEEDAANQAFAISACASAVRMRGNDPNSALPIPPGCKAVEFAQGDTCTALRETMLRRR